MDGQKISGKNFEKAVEEAVKYGAVHALLYFDAHAADEETVRAALVDFVSRLSGFRGLVYCNGEILEVIRQEGARPEEGFSSTARVEVVADNFSTLVNACLQYAPMAVEVLAPAKISINTEQAQAILLDASQASQDFSQMIYAKILKSDEYKALDEALKKRIEAGKKLMEKAKSGKELGGKK